MGVNVKLGNNTINNVDSVKLESADVAGTYHTFNYGQLTMYEPCFNSQEANNSTSSGKSLSGKAYAKLTNADNTKIIVAKCSWPSTLRCPKWDETIVIESGGNIKGYPVQIDHLYNYSAPSTLNVTVTIGIDSGGVYIQTSSSLYFGNGTYSQSNICLRDLNDSSVYYLFFIKEGANSQNGTQITGSGSSGGLYSAGSGSYIMVEKSANTTSKEVGYVVHPLILYMPSSSYAYFGNTYNLSYGIGYTMILPK